MTEADAGVPDRESILGPGDAPEPPQSLVLAYEIVAQLAAAGVCEVVLAPGSRSAPFAYALADAAARADIRLHVRIDERGAGFMALGLARARGIAAVVTTSGTAVANLHPAMLEASHAGVPLIVLSADRPAELRGTGANQTTIQPGIFADAVRSLTDCSADTPRSAVRGIVARAVAAARGSLSRDPGPVHLNAAFREPLAPPAGWLRQSADVTGGKPPSPVEVIPIVPGATVELSAARRTLLVAGDGAGPAAADLALAVRWPLLAEPSSGARGPESIRFYRDLLAAGLADRAERVVVMGHPTLSRPVSALLARRDIEIVVVAQTARWTDVAGAATRVVPAVSTAGPGDEEWYSLWQDADAELERRVTASLPGVSASNRTRPLLSPHELCADVLWRAGGQLVLGSSSTIRAFDSAPGTASPDTWANRGLSGIDGTIATATGIAVGTGRPVRVVVGDLTFLHDLTSLARGVHEPEVDLQVVVLDDAGGSIFSTLEYGEDTGETFERVFATPQHVDVAAAARAFGAKYMRCGDAAELEAAAGEPVSGRSVVHVALERESLRAVLAARREVAAAVVADLAD